ncbi:putative oxidoreductase - protein [Phaeoacremonium minimum UCRPA7]|uniref:Putative oxidoreductase-protein n=1 Tax=Phaeoacremonium minimum (strain UCR-PA7) TaxID=1286976 RepID=R8BJ80_PHAM7|nr:putative oxidoreductase - protein [Phaeoacremonium minimum UCRPA7]EON99297.1 putative oxidoreductase - protein [Phaeoacremonium minimum UCRPA7]
MISRRHPFPHWVRHFGVTDAAGSATGTIGKYLTEALLKSGKHAVTALTRAESPAKFPEGVQAATVNYNDENSLIEALKGQQFLIITMHTRAPADAQSKIIRAAAKAGVPYVMTNHYGPDSRNEQLMKDIIIGTHVAETAREAESLGLIHIDLSCGFWYEFSLVGDKDRYGFNLVDNSVTFFDDGKAQINTSTLDHCGRAVAALLSLPILPADEHDDSTTLSKYFNNTVYISSFLVSQREMYESVKRATGTSDEDWKISFESSVERYKAAVEALPKGEHSAFVRLLYTRVFFKNGDGNFEAKHGLANGTLGLPKEDFDATTKAGIDAWKSGELEPY